MENYQKYYAIINCFYENYSLLFYYNNNKITIFKLYQILAAEFAKVLNVAMKRLYYINCYFCTKINNVKKAVYIYLNLCEAVFQIPK